MLAKLQTEQLFENAEIITLAFHVDYWNYLGWKDEFSSAEYSQRQNTYSKVLGVRANYTPQMIVDGDVEFVGSKEAVAKSEIAKAAKNNKTKIILAFDKRKSALEIKAGEISISEDAEILLAIAEDDLETSVKAGENSGQNLRHAAVVRDFQKIGEIDKGKTNLNKTSKVEIKSEWKMENLRLVVFVQGKASRKVFAISQIKFLE